MWNSNEENTTPLVILPYLYFQNILQNNSMISIILILKTTGLIFKSVHITLNSIDANVNKSSYVYNTMIVRILNVK